VAATDPNNNKAKNHHEPMSTTGKGPKTRLPDHHTRRTAYPVMERNNSRGGVSATQPMVQPKRRTYRRHLISTSRAKGFGFGREKEGRLKAVLFLT